MIDFFTVFSRKKKNKTVNEIVVSTVPLMGTGSTTQFAVNPIGVNTSSLNCFFLLAGSNEVSLKSNFAWQQALWVC